MWFEVLALAYTLALVATQSTDNPLAACPGYAASNVRTTGTSLTADLKLAGEACDAYGTDLDHLVLNVEYQTESRLHVQIYDAAEQVYQIPRSVLDPPLGSSNETNATNALQFTYQERPFSFAVQRQESGETIFNTSGSSLVFESQYLRLRTSLPEDPYIYGLGEDADRFRKDTSSYVRTLWSRDSYGAPPGTNLYGNHPVYFEHRPESGQTHGVFLFNSNGMDIKINSTDEDGQYLEYNTLGGIFDLYFLAGPSPTAVSQQYSEVVGKPAMFSYWHFGFHQCKYGYNDAIRVAQVISNYSNANIPLETMWTDIDYMYLRRVFTLDPERFPLEQVQDIVHYLHHRDQHYIVMVDPAVSSTDNGAYTRGVEQGIFLQRNDSIYEGAVWPGPAVFPDWFNSDAQSYWDAEFQRFFNPETGVDIDALWIDMNEASNFCLYPCENATQFSIDSGNPPEPPPIRTPDQYYPLPGWPESFQPPNSTSSSSSKRTVISQLSNSNDLRKRQYPTNHAGLQGRNLIDPPYRIQNEAGSLSNKTIDTDIRHANGLMEYDTHNLYGTMMSSASRRAMLSRRPDVRPLVITRSTFAGAGADVGHWLGDNEATWAAYRQSIYQIQAFAALYQVPMVGADVCGFGGNTTEQLCARWAALGAFYPFFRNHANYESVDHEFYRWESVARAARAAIARRYRLLDYIYTALGRQTRDGTPLLSPLWFKYPRDRAALDAGLQFFYGDALLVSPVTEENSTSADVYLPEDRFYDLYTGEAVEGRGETIALDDVDYESIPVHVRGGHIVPLRAESANTTTALREQDFILVVAPDRNGCAKGSLYLDDGDSLIQDGVSYIDFVYGDGVVSADGSFGYRTERSVVGVQILGKSGGVRQANVTGSLNGSFRINVA